jgi:quercetin dioxygenase-like cupin family protein
MSPKHFVVTPADRKTPLNVMGAKITVLASGAEVSDQRVTLQRGDEGIGPPPHSHAWNESFYICSGQVEFTCAGETAMCGAGTFVHVPAGTIHAFHFGPGGGEMIEITGGASNAIEMFTALDRECPPGPPDIETAVRVLGENGVTVHA